MHPSSKIGELPSTWYLGVVGAPPPSESQDQRPLFEQLTKDGNQQKLYLYYFPPKSAWVVSPTVGGDSFYAYGEGDVSHPTLLCSFWNLKDENGGGFSIDIDIDIDVTTTGATFVAVVDRLPLCTPLVIDFDPRFNLQRCSRPTTI